MSARTVIQVRVSIPLRIDTEAWDATYGTGLEPSAVRDDVVAHVENLVLEQLRGVQVLAEVLS